MSNTPSSVPESTHVEDRISRDLATGLIDPIDLAEDAPEHAPGLYRDLVRAFVRDRRSSERRRALEHYFTYVCHRRRRRRQGA